MKRIRILSGAAALLFCLAGLFLPTSCRAVVTGGVVVTVDPSSTVPASPNETSRSEIPIEDWCAHEHVELIADLAPTCVAEGYRNREKCLDCGLVLDTTGEILAAEGHIYEGRQCKFCKKNQPSLMLEGVFPGSSVSWKLYDDGELSVEGRGAIPSMPAQENSYFFKYNKFVKSIVISNGVTSVGDNVFRNLKDALEISIASSVTEIGNRAFDGWSLKTLRLSENLLSVGEENFTGNQLFFLELPGRLRSVGAGSFASAQMVTLRVPSSVTRFETVAGQFFNLSNLAFVGSEEQFERLALCRHLKTDGGCAAVRVHYRFTGKASSLPYCTKRGQREGDFVYAVYTDKTARLTGYKGSSAEVTVPEKLGGYTVTAVNNTCFKENTVVKKLTLPATCTVIYKEAFLKSTLEEITFLSPVMCLDASAFEDCKSLTVLNFEGVFTDVGAKALANTKFENIVLSPDMKVARESAFAHSAVKNVDFRQFEIICASAFGYTSTGDAFDLTGVREIGMGAFYRAGVKALNVTNVGSIGRGAFSSNSTLTKASVTGIDTVGKIDENAFDFSVR